MHTTLAFTSIHIISPYQNSSYPWPICNILHS